MYDGGGNNALIDGLRGTPDFRTGGWQGYEGRDMMCIVDLGSKKAIQEIGCGFLQDENSWIFFPYEVEFEMSLDGTNYSKLGIAKPHAQPRDKGSILESIGIEFSLREAKYIKITAKSLIECPVWHKGAAFDGKAWVFADEITIQ